MLITKFYHSLKIRFPTEIYVVFKQTNVLTDLREDIVTHSSDYAIQFKLILLARHDRQFCTSIVEKTRLKSC